MNRRHFLEKVSVGSGVMALAPGVIAAEKSNAIQRENQRVGTTDWLLTKVELVEGTSLDDLCRRRKAVEGFCSHTSIKAGETLKVYVSTEPESEFKADVFRMGYYGGSGGRHMKSFGPFRGTVQPTPSDGPKKVIECHWKESFSFTVPEDWLSGVYLGKLTALKSDYEAYFVFIVRDERRADFLFQCSDMTWQAYNRWPAWRSLYDFEKNKWHTDVGNDVGFDRPYAPYYNGLPWSSNPLPMGS